MLDRCSLQTGSHKSPSTPLQLSQLKNLRFPGIKEQGGQQKRPRKRPRMYLFYASQQEIVARLSIKFGWYGRPCWSGQVCSLGTACTRNEPRHPNQSPFHHQNAAIVLAYKLCVMKQWWKLRLALEGQCLSYFLEENAWNSISPYSLDLFSPFLFRWSLFVARIQSS